jgi:glycosyltransferase involved in cell wall biosynthesis
MIDCCGAVSDADKEYVYNLASVFAYPSFFEGFGFPPLEAMKCGVPVVSSNNSSIPEVVGNAGILIDPDRPEDIKKALASLISDEGLKKILVERGLSRSKMFDWKNTAKKIIKIFNEMPEDK